MPINVTAKIEVKRRKRNPRIRSLVLYLSASPGVGRYPVWPGMTTSPVYVRGIIVKEDVLTALDNSGKWLCPGEDVLNTYPFPLDTAKRMP